MAAAERRRQEDSEREAARLAAAEKRAEARRWRREQTENALRVQQQVVETKSAEAEAIVRQKDEQAKQNPQRRRQRVVMVRRELQRPRSAHVHRYSSYGDGQSSQDAGCEGADVQCATSERPQTAPQRSPNSSADRLAAERGREGIVRSPKQRMVSPPLGQTECQDALQDWSRQLDAASEAALAEMGMADHARSSVERYRKEGATTTSNHDVKDSTVDCDETESDRVFKGALHSACTHDARVLESGAGAVSRPQQETVHAKGNVVEAHIESRKGADEAEDAAEIAQAEAEVEEDNDDDDDDDDEEDDDDEDWGEDIGQGWYLVQEEGAKCYFWHEPTDLSQWEHPIVVGNYVLPEACRDNDDETSGNQNEESEGEDDTDDDDDEDVEAVDWRVSIGQDWYRIEGDKPGDPPYYWHRPSDLTQWQRPFV
jgi:hypothetical protein